MKLIFTIFTVSILFNSHTTHSQNYDKITLSKKDPIDYYLSVKPQGETKGVMVLLPGFGDIPENIYPETKLHNIAFINNIQTITLSVGNKIMADEVVEEKINRVIEDVIKRFKVSKEIFVIGGFSAGGSIALRYAELTNESNARHPVKMKAVFAIDSPIDIVDLMRYFEREIEKNYSDIGVGEAKFISKLLITEYGDPAKEAERYNFLNPFDVKSKEQGNEKSLREVPVRVYHDIDIAWQLKNRRRSAYDCNFLNSSELINRLMLQGNNQAEFIMSAKPAYRSNGDRHTHSWSVVDEVDHIQWMKKLLKFN